MYLVLGVILFFISSCHIPITIKPNNLSSKSIQIAIDTYGIPYINAPTPKDALYALGYMHAKDRLFQLDMIRHLALGKLAEMFGEKFFDLDEKFRLLTYNLSEQEQYLSDYEKDLLKSYVLGINKFAQKQNSSTEHFLIDKKFLPFSTTDVLAIARLYVWILGNDLNSELARFYIANADIDKELKNELLAPIDSLNSHIFVNKETHFNGQFSHKSEIATPFQRSQRHVAENLPAGSNAWAINAKLMKDKFAVLMNDPHLRHELPSNFYLASLETPDFSVKGASLVGLPAILIGMGNKISFGITASLVNTQDAIKLEKAPKKEWIQEFCTKNKKCFKKTYLVSEFGPIMDTKFNSLIPKNAPLALYWTGFLYKEHTGLVGQFIELAKANSVYEAQSIIKNMTMPGVNILLADTLGNIAYAFAGSILQKTKEQHPFLPLNNLAPDLVAKDKKPFLINPQSGFLVNANQNLFDKLKMDHSNAYGMLGAESYRAARIIQRINEQIKKNQEGLNIEELASIQIDSVSLEAKKLAPLLGDMCINKDFGLILKNFDGDFTTDSLGALPYIYLINIIIADKLKKIFGDYSHNFSRIFHIDFLIKESLFKQLNGEKTNMFASEKFNWREYANSMCEAASNKLKAIAGNKTWKYRYGRHHYLRRASPLSQAPIIGKFFRDKKRESAGYYTAPMAESGLPITYGANLRMIATMNNPPSLRMVIDSGNSGIFGSKHHLDQATLWHKHQTILFYNSFEEAYKNAEFKFDLD